jgi:hypothetical protein
LRIAKLEPLQVSFGGRDKPKGSDAAKGNQKTWEFYGSVETVQQPQGGCNAELSREESKLHKSNGAKWQPQGGHHTRRNRKAWKFCGSVERMQQPKGGCFREAEKGSAKASQSDGTKWQPQGGHQCRQESQSVKTLWLSESDAVAARRLQRQAKLISSKVSEST